MKWCSGFYPRHSSVEGNQVNHEPVKNNNGLDSQGSSPPCMSSNPNSLQMLTMAKRLAWGILVHCTLLSTSHFVRQKSLAGPPRPTTILTCSELVNVSGCMQACWRGWKGWGRERDRHMKGLHVVRTVVEGGPLKHCPHYALPEEKKAAQWKWNDPSGPAVMWHLCFESLQSQLTCSSNLFLQHKSNFLF